MILSRIVYGSILFTALFILTTSQTAHGQDEQQAGCVFLHTDRVISGGSRLLIPLSLADCQADSSSCLVLEVTNNSPVSGIFALEFFRRGNEPDPRLTCRIGLLPGIRSKVTFPLSYLEAQQVFLPRYPGQLKGTVSGQRIRLSELSQLAAGLQTGSVDRYHETLIIHKIEISEQLPEPLSASDPEPWVDSLGQWTHRDWKGKLHAVSELAPAWHAALASLESASDDAGRSRYQGWKEKRFDSTGFFHTHHDGRRWWFVDPGGYAYLSVAPTGVSPYAFGPYSHEPALFGSLPDSLYFAEAYSRIRDLNSISYLTVNYLRIFGSEWEDSWISHTRKMLLHMHFNGSGNWSDRSFHKEAQMPYVYPMWGSPQTDLNLFRDFPDVFDPAFSTSAQHFAQQLKPMQDDPWMIGYFLGNEPHWAFGDFNLAREMMYTATDSHTRQAFLRWLEEKYGHPDLFSAAWEIHISSFADLQHFVVPHEQYITPTAEQDMKTFTDLMIHQYASVVCDAVKEAAPHHLNLGLRFAWLSSEACLKVGAYFDVFSLNGYSWPEPPDTERIARELNMPVLIGEFHFGSTDRGLPATGIRGMASQRDRAWAYRHYVEHGFARPEIIGLHYFQWNDQPVTGRFDGENYNIGILDVTGRPYPEMARAISRTNSRIYAVATGEKKPWPWKGKPVQAIYY